MNGKEQRIEEMMVTEAGEGENTLLTHTSTTPCASCRRRADRERSRSRAVPRRKCRVRRKCGVGREGTAGTDVACGLHFRGLTGDVE
jgi:hypothetical protein